MEEDIQSYLPTVMFRGTPCTFTIYFKFKNFNFYLQFTLVWRETGTFSDASRTFSALLVSRDGGEGGGGGGV